MTHQELNEQVARKLGVDHHALCHCPAHKDYCGSIQAAWEIFSFVKSKHPDWQVSVWRVKDDWGAMLGTADEHYVDYADTAPLAIVKAFLKLP